MIKEYKNILIKVHKNEVFDYFLDCLFVIVIVLDLSDLLRRNAVNNIISVSLLAFDGYINKKVTIEIDIIEIFTIRHIIQRILFPLLKRLIPIQSLPKLIRLNIWNRNFPSQKLILSRFQTIYIRKLLTGITT